MRRSVAIRLGTAPSSSTSGLTRIRHIVLQQARSALDSCVLGKYDACSSRDVTRAKPLSEIIISFEEQLDLQLTGDGSKYRE